MSSYSVDGSKGLSAQQIEQFNQDGYLVLPNAMSSELVFACKERAMKLLTNFDATTVSVFTTNDQTRVSDDYFLESGDKIRCFFEEDAFDTEGNLKRSKEFSINKIGHGMHDLDDVFEQVTYAPYVADIYKSLGFERPLAVQSMYITKQPGIGGEVRPHQDGTFLYTEPQSVVGLWWALEHCSTENGCLWAVPGSHRQGVHQWFRRKQDGIGTEFTPKEVPALDITGAVPLEMEPGDAVLLHAAIVHYSEANKSDKSRHAFSIHVIEGGNDVQYPTRNWLQRTDGKEFRCLYDHIVKPTL